jgi:hypothetical protein
MGVRIGVLIVLIGLFAACDGDDDDAAHTPPGGSPTAVETSALSPTPPTGDGAAALTYVAEGAIWIADPPGAPARFADATPCGRFPVLEWSPDGERLACLSLSAGPPFTLAMWDAMGALLLERDLPADARYHVLAWSPNSGTLLLDVGGRLSFSTRQAK